MLIYTPHAAAHLEPFSAEELFHCGHCALRGGLLATGRHYLKKSKLTHQSAAAAINYGVALQLSGDIPAAIAKYRQALVVEPGNEAAAKNLAWAYALSGSDANVTRQQLLTAYEKSWVRLIVQIAGEARPTTFLLVSCVSSLRVPHI